MPLEVVVGVEQDVDHRAGFLPGVGVLEELAETAAVVVARRAHPELRPRFRGRRRAAGPDLRLGRPDRQEEQRCKNQQKSEVSHGCFLCGQDFYLCFAAAARAACSSE